MRHPLIMTLLLGTLLPHVVHASQEPELSADMFEQGVQLTLQTMRGNGVFEAVSACVGMSQTALEQAVVSRLRHCHSEYTRNHDYEALDVCLSATMEKASGKSEAELEACMMSQ
ncbi:hypothetical protein [Shewanella litorisediminis]|uniref:Uncharacterized protein n=1 Tax=Shewanella litorisediminis TaxID=1173586 RepID=A0ABX7G5A1_9GAMM|nr:hypothetical protein [Shewanella litorisediminis]MCL2918055.1 hypothetical protein [Shewanella litorisediminis]QRH02485.1 hypothetical protein JQC75_03395 [Shewanella litorisediminis]